MYYRYSSSWLVIVIMVIIVIIVGVAWMHGVLPLFDFDWASLVCSEGVVAHLAGV